MIKLEPVIFFRGHWIPLSEAKAAYPDAAAELIQAQEEREARIQAQLEARRKFEREERARRNRAKIAKLNAEYDALQRRLLAKVLLGEGTDAFLNRLDDHTYIEWKFLCASRPSRRWLAPL